MISQDKFIESGGLDNRSITSLDFNEVVNKFNKEGCLIFRNFSIDPKSLTNLTDIYSHSYAVDTLRRDSRLGDKQIKNVDSGNNLIKLHSEASFTTTWPEILWFFCKTPSSKGYGGATTICDSIDVWNNLSKETKAFFFKNPIVYNLKIPVLKNRKEGKEKKLWNINHVGASDGYIDWSEGALFFKFTRYAVHESKFPNKFCFSNHLFVDLDCEPQILSRTLLDGSNIPIDIYKEINEIADKYTHPFEWQEGDLMMIDNKRYLHGREGFKEGDVRDILSIQTQKASFPYDASWRKSRT